MQLYQPMRCRNTMIWYRVTIRISSLGLEPAFQPIEKHWSDSPNTAMGKACAKVQHCAFSMDCNEDYYRGLPDLCSARFLPACRSAESGMLIYLDAVLRSISRPGI